MREAIINAFCHRDYRDPEYVQVAVFKNRVEIRNPGTLYGGLTLESLRQGKLSRRRNPLIAQLLTRIHMMEAWGRGMSLILENEPGAQFEELAGIFIASFARPPVTEETDSGEAGGDFSTKTSTKTNTKTNTITAVHSFSSLTKEAKGILSIIEAAPTISLQEIAVEIGLSKGGTRYHIDKLKKLGVLRRVGGAKGGHWEIILE